jgi:hypothetical protein
MIPPSKHLTLAVVIYLTFCYTNCQSISCTPPDNILKNIKAIELLADDIIYHKSEILVQNAGLDLGS